MQSQSTHASSATKDGGVKGKAGGSGLSLVSCFSFRSKKAAAVAKKSKSKATGEKSPSTMPLSANGATTTGVNAAGPAVGTMRSGVPPRKPPRTIGASFEQRQYVSIHSAAKIAMDDYVSVVYTRKPFRPPQHIYENVDEVRHLMGFGYAPPPLAREEDSASLSPQQYSTSLNDDPTGAHNDRLRDFDDEEGQEDDNGYRREGFCNAARVHYYPTGGALTLRKPSLRTAICSHQARDFPESCAVTPPRPNMSYISQASSLCPPDQMSTASLRQSGRSRPLLHSTFNYPLHSTVVTEEGHAEEGETEETFSEVQSPLCTYDSPFQRRGAQRWPKKGVNRGGSSNSNAYGTTARRPATLGGRVTAHHQQQPVQYECMYVVCEDSRRYNTRSGSHIRQVMDGDNGIVSSTTTSGSSIVSNTNNSRPMSRQSSVRSMVSNNNALPPAGGLQRKASFRHEVADVGYQTLQRRPSFRSDCSSSTSGSDLRQVQRVNGQQQHMLQRKASFNEQTNSQQVQRKTTSIAAPQRQIKPVAASVQRQPSFGDPFGMKSMLQRQESLLTEINRCLAPRLQRKPQPESPDASFASDSTFASVTRIDTALLSNKCLAQGDANDDSTLLDDDGLENEAKKITNIKGTQDNNVKTTEMSRNVFKLAAKPPIAQQEDDEETGEDYETCADDFSRRLTLMAKRCPTNAGNRAGRFRTRPQSIISECSTCYNAEDEQMNSNQNLNLLEENSQEDSSTSNIQADDSTEEVVQAENRRNKADGDESSEMWLRRRQNIQKKIEQFQHEYAQTIADTLPPLKYC